MRNSLQLASCNVFKFGLEREGVLLRAPPSTMPCGASQLRAGICRPPPCAATAPHPQRPSASPCRQAVHCQAAGSTVSAKSQQGAHSVSVLAAFCKGRPSLNTLQQRLVRTPQICKLNARRCHIMLKAQSISDLLVSATHLRSQEC